MNVAAVKKKTAGLVVFAILALAAAVAVVIATVFTVGKNNNDIAETGGDEKRNPVMVLQEQMGSCDAPAQEGRAGSPFGDCVYNDDKEEALVHEDDEDALFASLESICGAGSFEDDEQESDAAACCGLVRGLHTCLGFAIVHDCDLNQALGELEEASCGWIEAKLRSQEPEDENGANATSLAEALPTLVAVALGPKNDTSIAAADFLSDPELVEFHRTHGKEIAEEVALSRSETGADDGSPIGDEEDKVPEGHRRTTVERRAVPLWVIGAGLAKIAAKLGSGLGRHFTECARNQWEEREAFTKRFVSEYAAEYPEYNVVVVHTHYEVAGNYGHVGYTLHASCGSSFYYNILFAKKGDPFSFTLWGDGGYINWAYLGEFQVSPHGNYLNAYTYQNWINVYQHSQYQGRAHYLAVGNWWYMNDLNDDISSVWIPYGYYAHLYEHSHYNGAYLTLYGSRAWIGYDWNDRISSIIVGRWRY